MGRIIKRYENRKLYDTEARKYVSLEELAGLIRSNVDVQVIDRSSETDITTQTLTQIIFEEGKKGQNPFSKELLHDIIRWGNSVIGESLQQVKQGLDQIIPGSLTNLLSGKKTDEFSELKQRVQSLELLITKLTNQASGDSDKTNS